MMIVQTFVRYIFRFFFWSTLLLVLLTIFWYAANRLLDQEPYAGRIDFLISTADVVPDDKNIAIGLLGLLAPQDSNYLDFGSKIAELHRESNFTQIARKKDTVGALELTVSLNDTFCWMYAYGVQHPDCLPLHDAEKILAENEIILYRLRSLYSFNRHSNLYRYFLQDLIELNRLISADIYLHLEKAEHGIAYKKWRDHLAFSRKMLAGSGGLIDKIIPYLTLSFTLPLLEAIINAKPDLAIEKQAELLALLNVEDTKFLNLESIVRADYAFLDLFLDTPPNQENEDGFSTLIWVTYHFGQKHRIRNRFITFAENYNKLLRLPWPQSVEAISRLKETPINDSDWDWVLDPFGTYFLKNFLSGNFLIEDTLTRFHAMKGKLRLASLYIKISASGLSDDQIEEFINAQGSEYFDPLKNAPMRWDQSRRMIYLPHQDGGCGVYESFQIPKENSPMLLPLARANNQLC